MLISSKVNEMMEQNFTATNHIKSDSVRNLQGDYDLAGEDICKKARFIDGLFILSITMLPVSLMAIFSEIFGFRKTLSSSFVFPILLVVTYIIFFMLYSLIARGIIGQSLGKLAVGIKVVESDRGQNSEDSLFIRWLYYRLNNFPGSRLYWLLVDPKNKVIKDFPPEMKVVKSYDKKIWLGNIIIALSIVSFIMMIVSMFVSGGIGPIEHRYYNY
jgi:uncharacterized RDD family membrane protein YckC